MSFHDLFDGSDHVVMKQHIYPVEDIRPHNTKSDECWCNPCVEDDLVIHNAMDERESYEQGRKPS